MPKIYKLKDKTDQYTIKKDNIPNLPFRMIAVGSSGSGKTSVLPLGIYCYVLNFIKTTSTLKIYLFLQVRKEIKKL